MTLRKSSEPPPALAAAETLPPYLRASEPLEIEALPLQVSLLTMELASVRLALQAILDRIEAAHDDAGKNGRNDLP